MSVTNSASTETETGIELPNDIKEMDFLAIMRGVEQECKRLYQEGKEDRAQHYRSVLQSLQEGNPQLTKRFGGDPGRVPPLSELSEEVE